MARVTISGGVVFPDGVTIESGVLRCRPVGVMPVDADGKVAVAVARDLPIADGAITGELVGGAFYEITVYQTGERRAAIPPFRAPVAADAGELTFDDLYTTAHLATAVGVTISEMIAAAIAQHLQDAEHGGGTGDGGPAAWNDITGKPGTFTPSAHTHPILEIDGLVAALAAKAPGTHTHAISDTTGLQTALDGKSGTGHSHGNAVASGAAGFLSGADKAKLDAVASGATQNAADAALRDRSTHTGTQAISTVTGLQTALDAKAASSHAHAIADVTGLQTAIDGKAASAHTHDDRYYTETETNDLLAGKSGTGHSHSAATSGANGFMSAADKAKVDGIASGATANDSDANLRARTTHTGTQLAATISDLTEAVQDAVAAMLVEGTNITLSYDDPTGLLTIDAAGGGGGGGAPTDAGYLVNAAHGGLGGEIVVPGLELNPDALRGSLVPHSFEFEGSTLPTGYVWANQVSSTASVGLHRLALLAAPTTNYALLTWPMGHSDTSWRYRAKLSLMPRDSSDAHEGALIVRDSVGGKSLGVHLYPGSSPALYYTRMASSGALETAITINSQTNMVRVATFWAEIELTSGGNVVFRFSVDGVYFQEMASVARSTHLANNPDYIGVYGLANTAVICDYIRRES